MKNPFPVFRPVAMAALLCGVCLLPIQAQQSTPPQDPPKPTDYSYNISDAKDLRIAQLEFQAANKDLTSAMRDWSEACESLRLAKGWPKGTSCNIMNGEILPPPPEPPKPAAAPAPSKPQTSKK